MVKKLLANAGDARERERFDLWVRKIPWSREWQPPPVFLPGEFNRQRNLAGFSPWGCQESDTTERLTLSYFQFFYIASFAHLPAGGNLALLFVSYHVLSLVTQQD